MNFEPIRKQALIPSTGLRTGTSGPALRRIAVWAVDKYEAILLPHPPHDLGSLRPFGFHDVWDRRQKLEFGL